MREIKFRAWAKGLEEMLYQGSNASENNSIMDCQICLDGLGHSVLIRFYGEDNHSECHETVLMQYTGINDYYEGDIVDLACEYDSNRKGVIAFDNGCFVVERVSNRHDKEPLSVVCEVYDNPQVIGDVHQNPELLEVVPCPKQSD